MISKKQFWESRLRVPRTVHESMLDEIPESAYNDTITHSHVFIGVFCIFETRSGTFETLVDRSYYKGDNLEELFNSIWSHIEEYCLPESENIEDYKDELEQWQKTMAQYEKRNEWLRYSNNMAGFEEELRTYCERNSIECTEQLIYKTFKYLNGMEEPINFHFDIVKKI